MEVNVSYLVDYLEVLDTEDGEDFSLENENLVLRTFPKDSEFIPSSNLQILNSI